jgi:hypothetical protein
MEEMQSKRHVLFPFASHINLQSLSPPLHPKPEALKDNENEVTPLPSERRCLLRIPQGTRR